MTWRVETEAGASTVDKLSVGALGFGNRLPRESGFIPPGSGALCITRRGFFLSAQWHVGLRSSSTEATGTMASRVSVR